MGSPLLALSNQEWEDLCDGCGRCCLVKLEDEDSGELHYTNVACRFLNQNTCRCMDYEHRTEINPRCMVLDPDNLDALSLMPFTCAYRLLHEGRELERNPRELRVTGRVVSEEYIHDDQLPEHLVDWIMTD
ncbi:MAG: YcgN family cysteine cluster protein [Arenicellales bacterium]